MTEPAFFGASIQHSVAELAVMTGSKLVTPDLAERAISHVGPIEYARPDTLTFLDNSQYRRFLTNTGAGAVICASRFKAEVRPGCAVLINDQPYHAFGKVLAALYPRSMRPEPVTGETGVSDRAIIAKGVTLEDGVIIEAGAVVGEQARIGRGSRVLANAVVGANVQIGRDCTIGINVTLTHALVGNRVTIHANASIGNDGFGYAMGPQGHAKVPQIGRVVLQDDVDIGASTTIDRGANRDTVIGEGTKIDNLVMIAHNCQIGRHCVIVAMTGMAGSVTIEDFVVLAAKVGIKGHTTIGAGSQIGAYSAIYYDIPPGSKLAGIPARPVQQWVKEIARFKKDAETRNFGK